MSVRATHLAGYTTRFGHPNLLGATPVPGGVNFSIFSGHATACTLVLLDPSTGRALAEIPFPEEFRIGRVYSMIVENLDYDAVEYAYRFDGPNDPATGLAYNPSLLLLDPAAKLLTGRDSWTEGNGETPAAYRCRIATPEFDWRHDRPLRIPLSELVIYEMHVRGFTRDPASGVAHPGTFAGLREKIPYLRDLGVNAVEFLPIFDFDELENTRTNPLTGERLCNYWGYSTIGFNAPKAGYAATGPSGGQASELKELIRDLHANGIQVILDVVYNHTAEGGANGPTLSFRGIDNRTYYMLLPDGSYANHTGCGNTVNCNHPVVRNFICNSLRYWAAEYHIDGFRFDLASVLTRGMDGTPLTAPPLIEALAHDPILADCLLIAEAWDAGGLYQVGHFPHYHRWIEWNGKFRDAARRFLKGDNGITGEMVQRVMGSPDLYKADNRTPSASINFITCHDGFTLLDLVSYNDKHNLENGENNRDGANDNWCWNCGVEGPSDDPAINALRRRQQRNAFAMMLVSQGIPMLYMGDECGRTQRGNNNAYCHDEPWNWFDWKLPDENAGLLRFVQLMIAFRKAHPALRNPDFFTGIDQVGSGYPDISWHGVQAWKPDWGYSSRTLAFMLCGKHAKAAGGPPHFVYVAFNMYFEPLTFEIPVLPKNLLWHRFAYTGADLPDDITTPGEEIPLDVHDKFKLLDRSCLILVGK